MDSSMNKITLCAGHFNTVIVLCLYFTQYLPILKDSKCYLTNPECTSTAQALMTGIPQSERQSTRDDQ